MSARVLCVCLLALAGAAADARAQAVTRAFLRADLASPQQADSYINFEARAEGGREPHEFKWWLWDGTSWQVLRDWNLRPGLTWNPETPGQYIVAIWARSQGGSVNAAQALAQLRYDITPHVPGSIPAIHIFFTRNGDPFYVNSPILLEAWVSGAPPVELKWVSWDGQRWTVLREWQRDEVAAWTPTAVGVYRIAVWARHGGATADAPQTLRELLIEVLAPGDVPRAHTMNFAPDLPSPQVAGTPVTFSAFSTGGRPPYEYKWWQWDGTVWTMLADWSPAPTLTWTQARAGRYTIAGWTRSQGTSVYPHQPTQEVEYVLDPPGTPSPARSARLEVEPSQFPNSPTWFLINTPLHFTASASGGVPPYQFKWWVYEGTAWRVLREWSEQTTLTWTPASAGSYYVAIWARSHGVTQDASQALGQVGGRILTGNEIAPPSASRITSNPPSPQRVGTPVTFTATAQGGAAPYQFKWWLSRGDGPWQVLRDWNASPTLTWTASEDGSYRVATWARSNGVTENLGNVLAQVSYRIDPLVSIPPVTGATLTSNLASPQPPGTPITFTAAASGGQAPAEFKWWVWNGTVWSVLRNWNTSTTLTWTPSAVATYRVAIWARSSGATADARQALAQVDYRIDSAAPIPPVTGATLVPDVASPQYIFTPITFTATATGGRAPAEFKWWIKYGTIGGPGPWVVLREWSTTPTYTWTPRSGGNYVIAIWVRSSGATEDARQGLAQVSYTIEF